MVKFKYIVVFELIDLEIGFCEAAPGANITAALVP